MLKAAAYAIVVSAACLSFVTTQDTQVRLELSAADHLTFRVFDGRKCLLCTQPCILHHFLAAYKIKRKCLSFVPLHRLIIPAKAAARAKGATYVFLYHRRRVISA